MSLMSLEIQSNYHGDSIKYRIVRLLMRILTKDLKLEEEAKERAALYAL